MGVRCTAGNAKKNTDRPKKTIGILVGEDGFPPSEDKLLIHLPCKEKYRPSKKDNRYFWWGKMDSNHRRHCQQIYSLSPLATREFPHMQLSEGGAGRRTRTPDLLITNQLLYQLSYTSTTPAYVS